jgi:hypothetical protein
MRPRADGSAERALGVAFLALVLVKLLSGPAAFNAARLSGAVVPNTTRTHSIELGRHVEILSIAGDRRVLLGPSERASALHVLVVLPPGASTTIDRSPGAGGSLRERTIASTYRLDEGAHGGATVVSATYDLVRRTATIDGQRYRLSRGNLFVVLLNDELHPIVTQLDATVGEEQQDQRELLRAFRSAAREDLLVRGVLDVILATPAEPHARPRRNCLRGKAPAAAT